MSRTVRTRGKKRFDDDLAIPKLQRMPYAPCKLLSMIVYMQVFIWICDTVDVNLPVNCGYVLNGTNVARPFLNMMQVKYPATFLYSKIKTKKIPPCIKKIKFICINYVHSATKRMNR